MQEMILLFSLMIFLFLAGVPIGFSLLTCSTIFLLITDMRPLIVVPQQVVGGIDSFPLLAIPLFILMGNLMGAAGLSGRLIALINMLVGHVRGSLGVATVVSCAMFGALTGSAPATVAAIGSIMIPAMLKQGYPPRMATGVTAASGALGNIIPPSIALILYGATMNVSIPKLFIANVAPGILLCIVFVITVLIQARRLGLGQATTGNDGVPDQRFQVVLRSLPALTMPVVILGGIYGGIFTPTEAAAIGVLFSFLLGICYRALSPRALWKVLEESVCTSALVGFILGAAGIFGWILAAARIPSMLANGLAPMLDSPELYLVILTVFLLIVGCIMDAGASIIILAPILVPIGLALGLDPIHLGVVFCVNLVVGFFTPPFGLNLFTAASVSGMPYSVVVRGVLPYVAAAILALLAIAFLPMLSLGLTKLM
ncbi:TRAP transporter large permease [Oceanibacterium hippocampi]|uniref:TRAP transporter large permease protein n=1 Tax=Oceanibacterium hippocampi TaxID=745714 RepID=A0A1Y5TPV3_9PROT|nr:TRAP transporter large permease [Oceanibacterium hippocampi]SLN65493.1 Sialic acid TRAP transporter permease protein SiaT [Oceanibacterium hippocampi]